MKIEIDQDNYDGNRTCGDPGQSFKAWFDCQEVGEIAGDYLGGGKIHYDAFSQRLTITLAMYGHGEKWKQRYSYHLVTGRNRPGGRPDSCELLDIITKETEDGVWSDWRPEPDREGHWRSVAEMAVRLAWQIMPLTSRYSYWNGERTGE